MALLSLICLAHDNTEYKSSFEINALKLHDLLSCQGDSLEVIYATSGSSKVLEGDVAKVGIFSEHYQATIDMVEKLKVCLDQSKGDICLLWTIDDLFDCDLALIYFNKIKSGDYV